jgi:hypothetical protein
MEITYSTGYKYRLEEDFNTKIELFDKNLISTFIELNPDGYLLIKKGYAWNGLSGPDLDVKKFIKSILIYDALRQLVREHGLEQSYIPSINKIISTQLMASGMNSMHIWHLISGWCGCCIYKISTEQ